MQKSTVREPPSKNEEPVEVHYEAKSWKGVYRVGAILTIIWGAMSFVVMLGDATLYKSGYPATPESYLQLISQHQGLANGMWSLWIVGDLMFLLPTFAFYLALRRYNRTLALIGSLLSGFYILYDVCVTELNSLTLVSLAHSYATAGSDALRASYVAAAAYGYNALPLQTVLSFGIGGVGWFLWSIVMTRKSAFGMPAAIFGIVANAIGIMGAAAPVFSSSYLLGLFQFLAVPLTGIWAVVIGIQLYRHRNMFSFPDRVARAVTEKALEV